MKHVHRASGRLHWSQCSCGMTYLELAHRAAWMRLFVDRRLFFCRACRQRMLIRTPDLRRPR
ncbi:MAG: hypothetical protein JWP08_342 [Bryobacterales bacterium]|nr:hypothetical protein [Bryobacterales bacterium]